MKTGRSPSGALRNFPAMGHDKFVSTFSDIMSENNDPEAMTAVRYEARRRGLASLLDSSAVSDKEREDVIRELEAEFGNA